MQDILTEMIVSRLNEAKQQLHEQFNKTHAIKVARHFALDNVLPTDIAQKIYHSFPKSNKMKLLHSRGELKLKYSLIQHTNQLVQDIHYALQDPNVVKIVEEITEIKNQIPDPSSHAGGVSALLKGYYINPHLDNSHDKSKKFYRTVNTLYYVSPDWNESNGGNYELWDTSVTNRIVVPCFFNRLVVMETNTTSWHAVNPVTCDAPRFCVFNYYFSKDSPEPKDYFHTASLLFNPVFKARPEQKIRRFLQKLRDTFL